MYEIPRARLSKRDKLCFNQQICTWCKQTLPLTSKFFHRDKNKKEGFKTRCKTCTKILADWCKSKPYKPRMTLAEHKRLNALQNRDILKDRIRIAARDAEYAADGIVLDNRKLSIPIRVCSKCAIQYPATSDYFSRCKQSRRDGLSGKCKTCTNTPRRKRRKPNRRKIV